MIAMNATNSRVGIMLTSMLLGLMSAASGVHAQETIQKSRNRSEPVAQKQAGNADFEKLLSKADELIDNGKPEEAYKLLEPFELKHSGDTRFDYLIGIAALDSGMPDKATLALERVLLVNPDSAAARMDMARAYFQLGDILRAKTEFARVLNQNPSDAARSTIQKYLEAIAEREAGNMTHVSGYLEGGIGYDSNVNNSTSQAQIIAGGTNVTLDPANVQVSDIYYQVVGGGQATHALIPHWELYAGADLRIRNYRMQKNFDALDLYARAGVSYGTRANQLRIGAFGWEYFLGGFHNSDIGGINAEWNHVFSPSNQLKIFGQNEQFRYVDPVMQPNDFNQQIIGGGWAHVLEGGMSSLYANLYHGMEQDISTIITPVTPDGGRIDGAQRFNGLRVGGLMAVNDHTTVFVNAGAQAGDYSKVNVFFLVQRRDRLFDLTLGEIWHWDKHLTLRPQISYAQDISNIVLYCFDRTEVSLNVSRDLR
jgi:tetratricopeptide (TPR) repeat protein